MKTRLLSALLVFLLISSVSIPAVNAVESPKSISPKEALELLINDGHVENLPSCEKCRQIGYKYDSSTDTWEIRGGYDKYCKYSGKTKKIKADNDDTRTKLLEYIYYVDQCSSKFSEEIETLLGLSGGVLMVLGGPAGTVGFTIIVGGVLIHLDNLGNEMNQCTKYAKEIYKNL